MEIHNPMPHINMVKNTTYKKLVSLIKNFQNLIMAAETAPVDPGMISMSMNSFNTRRAM